MHQEPFTEACSQQAADAIKRNTLKTKELAHNILKSIKFEMLFVFFFFFKVQVIISLGVIISDVLVQCPLLHLVW